MMHRIGARAGLDTANHIVVLTAAVEREKNIHFLVSGGSEYLSRNL